MIETTDIERASGVRKGERFIIDGVTVLVTDIRLTAYDEGVPTFEITTRPVTDAD